MRYYSSEADIHVIDFNEDGINLGYYSDELNQLFGNKRGSSSWLAVEDVCQQLVTVSDQLSHERRFTFSNQGEYEEFMVEAFFEAFPKLAMTPNELRTLAGLAYWWITWEPYLEKKKSTYVVCNINDGKTLIFAQLSVVG